MQYSILVSLQSRFLIRVANVPSFKHSLKLFCFFCLVAGGLFCKHFNLLPSSINSDYCVTWRQGSSDNMACLRGFSHLVFNEITSRNHRKHSTFIEQIIVGNMKFVYNTLLTSTHMNQGISLFHSGLVIRVCGACSIRTKT